jgi:deferrochelatase/peroxidase EfeB
MVRWGRPAHGKENELTDPQPPPDSISKASLTGVFPDDVIRDSNSQGLLAFLRLRADLDRSGAVGFLTELTEVIGSLAQPDLDGKVNLSACVGFSPSFFASPTGIGRFGLDAAHVPVGLLQPPSLGGSAPLAADLVIYAMSRSEALLAMLQQSLSDLGQALQGAAIARGYQRRQRRENFGFLDGLRNLNPAERASTVTTSVELEPDSPAWAMGGTYLAYLKVPQDRGAARTAGTSGLESMMGRRIVDGSRLDQPEGVDATLEPDFQAPSTPAASSHVRKAGPRGDEQGDVRIVRRGIPYLNLNPDLTLDVGLHFVSFQGSLDMFDTVLNQWLLNPDFPSTGAGVDQLLATPPGFAKIDSGAVFFVPPDDPRFYGAAIFDPPSVSASEAATHGRIVVRKKIVDASGAPVQRKSLRGFAFAVSGADGHQIGSTFATNSAGHAISGDLPLNQPLTLTEVTDPMAGTTPEAPVTVTLTAAQPREAVRFTNSFAQPPAPGYH